MLWYFRSHPDNISINIILNLTQGSRFSFIMSLNNIIQDCTIACFFFGYTIKFDLFCMKGHRSGHTFYFLVVTSSFHLFSQVIEMSK